MSMAHGDAFIQRSGSYSLMVILVMVGGFLGRSLEPVMQEVSV